VPDSAVGPAGRQVRCAACRHSWFQEPAPLDLVARIEAEVPPVVHPVAPPPVEPRFSEPLPPAFSEAPGYDAFAPAPPFRPRRNPARLWTMAAAAVGLALIGSVGALQFLGTPTWLARLGLPIGETEVPLLLQMPRKPNRRETPSGNELFELSGRVLNPTDVAQRVPDLLVELRDAQGRVIYGWTITPSKRTLAPREALNFDSAQIDVPKGSKSINFLFSGEAAR